MTEYETLLTVAEFASQPEIEKYPSQIYGWIKRGMPYVNVKRNGKTVKMISFKDALAWMEKRGAGRKAPSGKLKVSTVKSIPDARHARHAFEFDMPLRVGDFLSWDRGNNLGPAYGVIYKLVDTLACVSVEYRTGPVYLAIRRLRGDLATGAVKIVHRTSVEAFLLQQLARTNFLVHLTRGKDMARELKNIMLALELTPQDFTSRFNEEGHRRWPPDDAIEEEVSEDSKNHEKVQV